MVYVVFLFSFPFILYGLMWVSNMFDLGCCSFWDWWFMAWC